MLCAALLARRRNASGRSCDRPSGHRLVFLVFLSSDKCSSGCQVPSCHCMLLMQPSTFKLTKINPLVIKQRQVNSVSNYPLIVKAIRISRPTFQAATVTI